MNKKKRSVLLKMNFIYEIDNEELNSDELTQFDKLTYEMEDTCEKIGTKYNLKWESSSTIALNHKEINCGKCETCGSWVTDCEAPNRISELNHGARVDGKLLCNECLPKGHRWAF